MFLQVNYVMYADNMYGKQIGLQMHVAVEVNSWASIFISLLADIITSYNIILKVLILMVKFAGVVS